MSYQVIARKWRSRTFEELVGQEHITTTLINALKNNRLPHAMLFTGPRGTGKTSSARILAKSLRCPNHKDHIPCNICDSCQEINSGKSVDVIEIDGASNNGVDAVRELRESVGYMPATGRFKVYIIDEVHMLSTSAFNALLKTLEEPPEHVIFVMATTEAQKIPNTILSRCQRFDFRRIPVRQIAAHLKHICEGENIPFEDEAIWIVARQGDGSMRDSQSLLDQVITFCNGNLKTDQVIQVLGLTDRGLLNSTLKGLMGRDKPAIVDLSQKILNSGFDSRIFVQELLEQFRNLLMIKVGADAGIDLPDSEVQELKEIANTCSEEDIHFLFDMALKGANDLTRMSNPSLVFEMLLLRMVVAPSLQSLSNILSGAAPLTHGSSAPSPVTPSQGQTSSSASAQGPASVPPPTAPRTARVEPKAENWLALVAAVKEQDGRVGAMLENLALVSIDSDQLKLTLPAKLIFLEKQVTQPDFTGKLKDYVANALGKAVKISISIRGAEAGVSARVLEKEKKESQERDVEEAVRNHPFVKSTTQLFKGEIKEIKETT